MLFSLGLLACQGSPISLQDVDGAPSDQATADTAAGDVDHDRSGTASDEIGFEFDGGWYPVLADHIGCYTSYDGFVVVGDGNRDGATDTGASTMGMASAYFAARPTTGTYTLAYFDGYVSITGATEAAVTVFDDERTLFAYSDGSAGTVQVVEDTEGALTISWTGVSQYGAYADGGSYTSDSGSLTCP